MSSRDEVLEELAAKADAFADAYNRAGVYAVDDWDSEKLDAMAEGDPFLAIPDDLYYTMHVGRRVAGWLRSQKEGSDGK